MMFDNSGTTPALIALQDHGNLSTIDKDIYEFLLANWGKR